MKKLHYFPFYYLDWLSSSSVSMMTHEERGLYIDMLCRCYNDDGLPDDDRKLQRLFKCDQQALETVKEMFYSVDGLLKNEKLEQIIKDQGEMFKNKAKAGKASAKARQERRLQKATGVQQVLDSVPTEVQQNSTNKTKQNKEEQNKEKEYKEIFESVRKAYPGTKKGLDTEFTNFTKKHKDWKEVLMDMKALLDCQINVKAAIKQSGQFCPQWKNFQTWINQRSWEEEISFDRSNLKGSQRIKSMTKEELHALPASERRKLMHEVADEAEKDFRG